MDFGRTSSLENIDWSLPPDHPQNKTLLNSETSLDIHVGCPIWANPKWLGHLYPSGTPRQQFLSVYSRNFSAIEYNGSFYHLPSLQQVEQWKEKIADGFLFCPKFPKIVSHRQVTDRQTVEQSVEAFCALKEHLGLAFIQFSSEFDIKKGIRLKDIVRQIGGRIPLAVELRHPSWLVDRQLHPRVREYFVQSGLKTVILDTPGRRDLLHGTLTGDEVLIRFLASENQDVDRRRIRDWALRIRQWKETGLRKLYFFAHEPDDLHAPKLADVFIQTCNEICGEALERPRFEQQMSLL